MNFYDQKTETTENTPVTRPQEFSEEKVTPSEPTSSGLVFEEAALPAEPTVVPLISPETSAWVMTQMALGVIGITVGIAGSAVLLMAYISLVPPEVAEPEQVSAVEETSRLKVRKSIGDVDQNEPIPSTEDGVKQVP